MLSTYCVYTLDTKVLIGTNSIGLVNLVHFKLMFYWVPNLWPLANH